MKDWTSLKEITCTAIAALVMAGAFTLICKLLIEASPDNFNEEAYQRYLQLLNLVVAMAGSVIGYYFGRVPAEKLAQSAQDSATKAAKKEGEATSAHEQLKTNVRNVLDDMKTQRSTVTGIDRLTEPDTLQVAVARLDTLVR